MKQLTQSEMIEALFLYGGSIVPSHECSEQQIADAQADGRFCVVETVKDCGSGPALIWIPRKGFSNE